MSLAKGDDSPVGVVAALFEAHHQAVFAYLYRLVGDWEWAHDLTQKAFLQLLRTAERLEDVQNQRAWVYRVATNLAFNGLKRNRRFAWLPWRPGADHDAAGPDPAEQVAEHEGVARALQAVPVDYRAPLLLYSHEGLSVREVAASPNLSEGAVKNRLYRAREMFRQAYQKETA